ncbi:MAG: S8 family serine peptidase [Ignavibacteriales bacterium]|nr:S8 family serine peptidase [Ignavibacteriales bacterium]
MMRLILLISLSSSLILAQQLVVKTDKGTTTIPVTSSIQTSLANDSIVISKEDRSEKIQWIVELKSPSLLQQRLSKTKNISLLSSERSTVIQSIKSASPAVIIKKEFSVILNGFSVSATKDEISTIRSITDVKNVFEDITVASQPIDATSSGTTTIVSPDSISGKGIRIGVIDTGIDYTHESFGGGFGAGFQISGGYDFVNNDSDPMDDNGHGTHVAGIIGGHSATIKGIAYNAELYAYKVLSAQGTGRASDVLAAIERAVADSVDIINLSLGSSTGNPNDVLSEAVNRAVESGIVVVAAAGNTGEFETIHSPGVAEYALTVGASDGDKIASFSAKGPVSSKYMIKPDVVAPGVGIVSAKNGGGYIAMSGTSMATPLVTSIAAALKEIHPGWDAFQIKDAIISGAKDLNTPLFAQGNGVVSDKIFSAEVIVSPAHITFGFNSPTTAQWTKIDTIEIYNPTSKRKKYEFGFQSTNPALMIDIQPASLDLQPSTRQKIIITVTTNNLFLINNKRFSEGYTGKIHGFGENDTLTIPFTFFKGNVLHLEFNEAPWQVLVHNRKNFKTITAPKSNSVSYVLDNGTYDIVTSFFDSYYVIKENIPVDGFSSLTIRKDEAIHAISILPVNEKGNRLEVSETGTYSYVEGIMYKATGVSYVGLGGGMMTAANERVKYFSPVSDKYSFGYALSYQYGTGLTYTFETVLDSGITSAKQIEFIGPDLKKVEMKYSVASTVQKIFPITWTSFIGTGSKVSVTFYNGNDTPLTFPFVQTNYISDRKTSFPIFYHREAFTY